MEIAIIIGVLFIIFIIARMYRKRIYLLTHFAKPTKTAGTSAFTENLETLNKPSKLEVSVFNAKLIDSNGNVVYYKTTGNIDNYSGSKSSEYINNNGSLLISEAPAMRANNILVTCLLYDSQNQFLGVYSGASI